MFTTLSGRTFADRETARNKPTIYRARYSAITRQHKLQTQGGGYSLQLVCPSRRTRGRAHYNYKRATQMVGFTGDHLCLCDKPLRKCMTSINAT